MTVKDRNKKLQKVGTKQIYPQMNASSLYVVVTGGAGILLNSLNIMAASSSTNVSVKTSVSPNCKFIGTAGNLLFGSYDTHSTSPNDATGTSQIRCTKSTSVTLSINNGMYPVGPQRRMFDNSNKFLEYQIYTTASRTTIWNTTNVIVLTAPSSAAQTINLYGRIPAGQNVNTGGYSDTLVITANF